MGLLERVTMLVRANLNDLIDKAENPETMIKQVILDMQNQLLQVKTQVAVAMADQHVLAKKRKEHEAEAADWMRKAELAVDKQQDGLARAALERSRACWQAAEAYREQCEDSNSQVTSLRSALHNLEQKLAEAQLKSELLVSRQRRARALTRAGKAANGVPATSLQRLGDKVLQAEGLAQATAELNGPTVEDQFAALEKDTEINKLLAEIKARRLPPGV